MDKVVVIIPIYKTTLSDDEVLSLRQTCQALKNYPLVVIQPEGLDLSSLNEQYPLLQFQEFPASYFKGIMGYNRLMLSPVFYERFLNYEYMLICQLDAYIFRDELQEWCNKGYDYIGSPWLRRPVYDFPLLKQCMQFSLWWKHRRGLRSKQDLYNKVGNGGLSLRKVKAHYQVTKDSQELIGFYTNRKKLHLYNEDVFWALEAKDFSYPTPEEAMLFAFDKYPELAYKLTGERLPFGCHGWNKRKMRKFWKGVFLKE